VQHHRREGDDVGDVIKGMADNDRRPFPRAALMLVPQLETEKAKYTDYSSPCGSRHSPDYIYKHASPAF
jgi:hypothetical protein